MAISHTIEDILAKKHKNDHKLLTNSKNDKKSVQNLVSNVYPLKSVDKIPTQVIFTSVISVSVK
jgi:putative heme iron utilization protein